MIRRFLKNTERSASGSQPMGHASRVAEFLASVFQLFCGIGSRRHLYLLGSRGDLAFLAISVH